MIYKEYRFAPGICLCVITVPSALLYCAISLHRGLSRPPAASDYPALLTENALLHKDAAVVPFSIQRPVDTNAP